MSGPEEPADAPEPQSPELVEVTVQVPAALIAAYDDGVAKGYYATRDEALRHGLVESWRHHRGQYCTVRLDLLDSTDKRPDTAARTDPEAAETHEGDNPEEGDEGNEGETALSASATALRPPAPDMARWLATISPNLPPAPRVRSHLFRQAGNASAQFCPGAISFRSTGSMWSQSARRFTASTSGGGRRPRKRGPHGGIEAYDQ